MAIKYLSRGMEPVERLHVLISFTHIKSEAVINALVAHLAEGEGGGLPKSIAAGIHGVTLPNFAKAMRRLNKVAAKVERVKEIDARRKVV